MLLPSIVAVFCGAGFGALMRWVLGLWLNPIYPVMPLGTLAANLIGGLLIGIAAAFFSHGNASPEWRLLVVTGFLGGLTTFSTFSIEVVSLLVKGDYLWATMVAGTHLAGSLLMTAVGLALTNALLTRA